jgi:hypothetical protein
MLINAALSALFVFLIFGGRDRIPLWGMGGLAFDFLPQTFIIAFMATLVPSVLTRQALHSGKVAAVEGHAPKLPRNLFLRALLIPVLVSIVAMPLAILALASISPWPLPFAAVLPMKILYGAAVACVVTSCALRAVLCESVAR